jgi:phosphoenolpyruvate carboxykinase (ATP)
MLAEKMKKHDVNVWLLNTGWVGGKYGVGKRMDLPSTRAILDAIHDGSLEKAPLKNFPIFDMAVPEQVKGVDPKILWPQNGWDNKNEYDKTIKGLADAFQANHKNYESGCTAEINNAGPKY